MILYNYKESLSKRIGLIVCIIDFYNWSREVMVMTVQQQVAERINGLSEEGAFFIEQVLDSMKPTFFITTEENERKVDVKKRFGAGEGIIKNVEEFKSNNDEIMKMFEGFE